MAKFSKAHLIKGTDDFRRQTWQKQIVDETVPESTRDFNYDRLDGRTLDVETLLRVASTAPWMADARLLQIDEADRMGTPVQGRLEELLDAFAERQATDLVLLLIYPPGKKPPKSIESRMGRVYDCKALDEKQAPAWVRDYARKRNLRLSSDATYALLYRVGFQDTGRLSQEIDKLERIADGADITPEMIEEACPLSAEGDRFKLSDAILLRNATDALTQIDRLLGSDPHSAPLLISILSTQMYKILMLLARIDGGESDAQVRRSIGSGRYADKQWNMVTTWSLGDMERALSALFDTDFAIKQGAPPKRAMERFIQVSCI